MSVESKTIFERQEEIDYEWQDGDDNEIYELGFQEGFDAGFHEGYARAMENMKGLL